MKKASKGDSHFGSPFRCCPGSPQIACSSALHCKRERDSRGHYSGFAPCGKRAADYDKGGVARRCVCRDVISVFSKSALLQAAVKHHHNEVTAAVERVCREQKANTPAQMAAALITAFLEAKMRDVKTSIALYSVGSDVDGAKMVRQMGIRSNKAIVEMLASACEPVITDRQPVADMLQGVMAGVSRRLLESGAPAEQFATFRQELIFLACGTCRHALRDRQLNGAPRIQNHIPYAILNSGPGRFEHLTQRRTQPNREMFTNSGNRMLFGRISLNISCQRDRIVSRLSF